MNGPEFDFKSSAFWGAVTAIVTFLRFLLGRQNKKQEAEINLAQKLEGKIMADEIKTGIKETKEAIIGLSDVSQLIISKAKDGLQMSDAMEVVQKLLFDAEFKKVLEDAVNGIAVVPAEIKDLDVQEGIELAMLAIEEGKQVIEALKK